MLAIGRALMSRPTLAAAGRAVAGSGAAGGAADFRRDPGTEPVDRADRAAGGAERLSGAAAGASRLRAGERAITMAGTGAELLARPEIRAAYLEGGHA